MGVGGGKTEMMDAKILGSAGGRCEITRVVVTLTGYSRNR